MTSAATTKPQGMGLNDNEPQEQEGRKPFKFASKYVPGSKVPDGYYPATITDFATWDSQKTGSGGLRINVIVPAGEFAGLTATVFYGLYGGNREGQDARNERAVKELLVKLGIKPEVLAADEVDLDFIKAELVDKAVDLRVQNSQKSDGSPVTYYSVFAPREPLANGKANGMAPAKAKLNLG